MCLQGVVLNHDSRSFKLPGLIVLSFRWFAAVAAAAEAVLRFRKFLEVLGSKIATIVEK